MNVPAGAAPTTAVVGDLYTVTGPDSHLQFMDQTSTVQELAFVSDITAANATEAAAIAAETARAQGAETNLSGLIAAETTRATNAEGAEFTRATGAESALSTSIGNEVTRATGAESVLSASIGVETAARIAGDASTLSAAEAFSGNASNITSGTVGQAYLPGNVVYNDQVNTYTAGSKQVFGASNASAASMNVPAGAAPTTAVVGDLYTVTGPDSHLQFMDQTSTVQELAFVSDITAANATEAAAIAAETARAQGAETNLSGLIAAETTRATNAEGAEFTRATGAESALSTSIGNEVTRATGAESVLSASIGVETAARIAGDASTLSAAEAFSGNASNITSGTVGQAYLPGNVVYNDQANTYTAGKQTLAASTNAAASMNVPAGAAPTTAVVGDLYTVTGPDSHLQFMDQTSTVQELAFVSDITAANATEAAAIAAETARAQGAETNLSGLIAAETAARIAGDAATLSSANGYTDTSVATEAAARTAGDAAALSSANSYTDSSVATESLARIAGDAATLSSANGFTTTSVAAEAVLRAAGDASTLSAAEAFSANASNITSGTVGQAFLPSNVVYNNQANTYTAGKQTLAASTNAAASMNVPAGAAPTTAVAGDLYTVTGGDSHIRFVDQANALQSIAFLSDITNGSVTLVNTGAGLTGGPITTTGTISIATGGVTNAMLANSSVTVNPGTGLSGGGSVALGGSITLNNSGVLSFNGSTGGVTGVSSVASGMRASPSAGLRRIQRLATQASRASRALRAKSRRVPALAASLYRCLARSTSTPAETRQQLPLFPASWEWRTAARALTQPAPPRIRSSLRRTDQPEHRPSVHWHPLTCLLGRERGRFAIAGADNAASSVLNPAANGDSQNSYYHNMIGPITLTGTNSVWCQANTGTATIQLVNNTGSVNLMGSALSCTTAGANGNSSTAIANGDSLNFSLTAITGAPTRVTVCFSATVN